MYSSISYNSPTKNYRDHIVSNHNNYKNKLRILEETTIDDKIKIELSYTKKHGIYIKQFAINKLNMNSIISKCKKNNFIIEYSSALQDSNISNLESLNTNYSHHEYMNNNLNNKIEEKF